MACVSLQGREKTMSKRIAFGAVVAIWMAWVGAVPASAGDDDWKTWVNKYMSEVVKLVANAPEVIAAVQEQNVASAVLTADQIEALDRQWRAERKVNGGPLSN